MIEFMENVRLSFEKVKQDIMSLKERVTRLEQTIAPRQKSEPKKKGKKRITITQVNKRIDTIEERLKKLERRR